MFLHFRFWSNRYHVPVSLEGLIGRCCHCYILIQACLHGWYMVKWTMKVEMLSQLGIHLSPKVLQQTVSGKKWQWSEMNLSLPSHFATLCIIFCVHCLAEESCIASIICLICQTHMKWVSCQSEAFTLISLRGCCSVPTHTMTHGVRENRKGGVTSVQYHTKRAAL